MRLLLVALALSSCASTGSAPVATHDKSFWRAVVAVDYAPPAGADVLALARELALTASSTDGELRDDLGFEISARWIRRANVLGDDDVRSLLALHLSNQLRDLGQGESDGVFLRSFSALHLAQIAARDRRHPFLTQAERAQLVQSACRVLREERDRRGWVEGKGWAHPIAHNADLLAQLALAPDLKPDEQRDMLRAIDAGLAGTNLFGENERLAAVLARLATRADFVEEDFEHQLAQWSTAAEAVWQTKPFDVAAFHKSENAQALVRTVLLGIVLDPKASESEKRAAEAIRAAFFRG
jgi:Protein of unknown function (DUF2785)